jgi:Domain of unknown function (DUF1772).
MGWLVLRCLTLVIAALSLGPSFAHLLEAGPRLMVWSPELWRDATVFNGQYRLFGILGGPLDGGAILLAGALAYGLRKEAGFRFALAGAILYLVSLGVWLSVVAPVNAELATWQPGPIPEDFAALRNRWETGHIVMTFLKLAGFTALVLSVLDRGRPRKEFRVFRGGSEEQA